MNHVYAAAFFDADGCFVIDRGSPRLSVSQVDLHILLDYRSLYGGSIYRHGAKTKTARRSFRWMLGGEPALAAIRHWIPHLKGKRPQALAILEHRLYPPHSAMRKSLQATLKQLKRTEFTHDDIETLTDPAG